MWHNGAGGLHFKAKMWSRSRSQSLSFEGDSDPWSSVLFGLMCSFVAVYKTYVQFILQLKLCLCTFY